MNNMIQGRLEPFFETGTEGMVWSLHNPVVPGYGGLFPLERGDQLTVYNDAGDVIWAGIINLEYVRNWTPYPMNPEHGQQAVFGYWVHGFQADCEPEEWAQWFFDANRAGLIPANPGRYSTETIFSKPADAIRAVILDGETLSPELEKEFRWAQHVWINWFGELKVDADGQEHWEVSEYGGRHKDLHFTPEEALAIIGSPSAEMVQNWQLRGKAAVDRNIFYRLVLLSGIMGRLSLRFKEPAQMRQWVAEQMIDGTPMRDYFFTADGLTKIHSLLYTN